MNRQEDWFTTMLGSQVWIPDEHGLVFRRENGERISSMTAFVFFRASISVMPPERPHLPPAYDFGRCPCHGSYIRAENPGDRVTQARSQRLRVQLIQRHFRRCDKHRVDKGSQTLIRLWAWLMEVWPLRVH